MVLVFGTLKVCTFLGCPLRGISVPSSGNPKKVQSFTKVRAVVQRTGPGLIQNSRLYYLQFLSENILGKATKKVCL